MTGLGVLLAAALLAAAPGARAPRTDAAVPAVDVAAIRQSTLDEAARRFAALWGGGNAPAIAGMLHPGGVRLHLGQGGYASVGVRQASAALRDFHEAVPTSAARVLRTSEMDGAPRRGSAELECVAVGGTGRDSAPYALFVAFVQDGSEWRVSEIRVLR